MVARNYLSRALAAIDVSLKPSDHASNQRIGAVRWKKGKGKEGRRKNRDGFQGRVCRNSETR